jgi:fructose-1,6-bisphosphatase I
VVAGYALYSSATELVISGIGDETVVFTLDDSNAFRCSRTNITCPDRGPYYSLNEAREPDWPDGLRKWIFDAKRGETPAQMKYSARYICSLTADVHRTLLKGGWAGNPRPHLRLLYEAAPLAFIAEKSGGLGSDGINNLLDVKPDCLHQRVCCFIGSKLDIRDLEYYGDVQQNRNTYSYQS